MDGKQLSNGSSTSVWPAICRQFASLELRDDADVVLAAVRQDGHALVFASDQLKAEDSSVEAIKAI